MQTTQQQKIAADLAREGVVRLPPQSRPRLRLVRLKPRGIEALVDLLVTRARANLATDRAFLRRAGYSDAVLTRHLAEAGERAHARLAADPHYDPPPVSQEPPDTYEGDAA